MQHGPHGKTIGKKNKRNEENLKKIMGMLKKLFTTKSKESPELINEFTSLLSGKKGNSVDLNQTLPDRDSFTIRHKNQQLIINSPVFAIIALGYPELLKICILKGAKFNLTHNKTYLTLAQHAILLNRSNCLKVLLDIAGYDALSPLSQDCALMPYAAAAGSYECVKVISEHPSFNANRIDEVDSSKKSALCYAAVHGDSNTLEWLLTKGAKVQSNSLCLSAYDSMMLSFIYYLFGKKISVFVPDIPIADYYKTIQLFLDTGLVDPLLVSMPAVGLETKSVCVFSYLPALDIQQLCQRDILNETYFLYLAHGAGTNIELVPEHIKQLTKAPSNAELIVYSRNKECYFSVNTLTAAIIQNPSNFNLRSILKACSTPLSSNCNIVNNLKTLIQNILQRSGIHVEQIANKSDKDLLAEEMLGFSLINLEEKYSVVAGGTYQENEIRFQSDDFQIISKTQAIREEVESVFKNRLYLLGKTDENQTHIISERKKVFLSVCFYYFDTLRFLCDQKAILLNTDSQQLFIKRLTVFKGHLLCFINGFSCCYMVGGGSYGNNSKLLTAFYKAMIHGLQYLKKSRRECRLSEEELSDIDAIIAVSSSRILLNTLTEDNKAESKYYTKLTLDALPFNDDAFIKILPQLKNEIFSIKRDCYAVIALGQISDGYYSSAKKMLLSAINEASKANLIGGELFCASKLYMINYLERKNFDKVDEILLPIFKLMVNSQLISSMTGEFNSNSEDFKAFMIYLSDLLRNYNKEIMNKIQVFEEYIPQKNEHGKIIIDSNQCKLEIHALEFNVKRLIKILDRYECKYTVSAIHDGNVILTVSQIHYVSTYDFAMLMKLIQNECQNLMRQLEQRLNKTESKMSENDDIANLQNQFANLTFNEPVERNKRITYRKLKTQSIIDKKNSIEIEDPFKELECSIDDIYALLNLPKEGYSKPIMIRSQNGGFPDNTHFLCIKNAKEFNIFLQTLHSRDENITYSIPEKGRGQRGVKISHDHSEVRVKPYGDERAVGKCTKVVTSNSGAKIRLYMVDEIETHKERARARKHSAKK